jgi:hypothetical protein
MGSKAYRKKGNMLSSFGKKGRLNESNEQLTLKNLDVIDSEHHSTSQAEL